jgi:hypothetical protein
MQMEALSTSAPWEARIYQSVRILWFGHSTVVDGYGYEYCVHSYLALGKKSARAVGVFGDESSGAATNSTRKSQVPQPEYAPRPAQGLGRDKTGVIRSIFSSAQPFALSMGSTATKGSQTAGSYGHAPHRVRPRP